MTAKCPVIDSVSAGERSSEAGFTLVEALIAMVILMVGLAAVANMMIMAGTSNTAANLSSGATASATEAMETLKAQPFANLAPGTGFASPFGSPGTGLSVNTAYRYSGGMSGVGRVDTRWEVSTPANLNNVRFVEVRSQMLGRLGSGLSLTRFTTFRTCTEATGC
jgi:Tfp pilus assembly protein PilV